MSRDIHETYERAIAAATDLGNAPGRVLNALVDSFALKDDAFGHLARAALWRERGLVKTEIALDGPYFDIECLYQRNAKGVSAWVMPVFSVPAFGAHEADIVDLVAFADDGKHAGQVWRLVGAVDHIGLDMCDEQAGQRVLNIFTQPKNWWQHWLTSCAPDVKWLSEPSTGPEIFAALVLDPKKVNWRLLWESGYQEIRFCDSVALRDQVKMEMQRALDRLPRLRAIKAKPEEVSNGTPPAAA